MFTKPLYSLALVLLLLCCSRTALAYSNGPQIGCMGCHGGGSFGATIELLVPPGAPVVGGRTVDLTVRVGAALPDPAVVGFLIYIDQPGLSSFDPNIIGDGQTRLQASPVATPNTQTYPKYVDFLLQWTPPNVEVDANVYFEANITNGDQTTGGDETTFGTQVISICVDSDLDGFCNSVDSCPAAADPLQGDCDGDSIGDVCDPSCPTIPACAGKCAGVCGNSVLNLGEACDPPDAAGGCDAQCHQSAVCGNSVLELVFELCDDGNTLAGDYCSADCSQASGRCGDGLTQTNEACDCGDGSGAEPCGTAIANGDALAGCAALTCTKSSVCGNGVVEHAFETCDDGNALGGDYCSADCKTVTGQCGDGTTQSNEDCDCGGPGNPTPCAGVTSNGGTSGCSAACHKTAICGDSVLSSAFEACDDGNTTAGDGCGSDCAQIDVGFVCLTPGTSCDVRCGDAIVAGAERCDDGPQNSNVTPNACRLSCIPAHCGDGVLDTTEACDNGDANSDTLADACRTRCRNPRCGDGVTDVAHGEGCDDGNARDGDGCSSTCLSERCGDGIVDPQEECDSGASNDDLTENACRTWCVRAYCGDGVVDEGEACDAGVIPSDVCGGDCVEITSPPTRKTVACMNAAPGEAAVLALLLLMMRRRRRQ